MQDPSITTFSQHYKKQYGEPVGKIALDAGLACPNRKNGGCIFCAPRSFTPFYLDKGDSLASQLAKGKAYLAKRKFRRYFAYFQQETTTAAPVAQLLPLFSEAVADRDCIGLIISTRPDAVPDELLGSLSDLAETDGKEILLELGLQSAHDQTLRFLNRNHTFADFADTARRISQHPRIQCGVHLILGLPGETKADMLATIRSVVPLGIAYIKFHHLQIIKNTRLLEIYNETPFTLFGAQEYLETLAYLLSHVPREVVLHRLWSTASPEQLVLPRWNVYSHELHTMLMRIMREQELFQGKNAARDGQGQAL